MTFKGFKHTDFCHNAAATVVTVVCSNLMKSLKDVIHDESRKCLSHYFYLFYSQTLWQSKSARLKVI